MGPLAVAVQQLFVMRSGGGDGDGGGKGLSTTQVKDAIGARAARMGEDGRAPLKLHTE